MFTIVWFVSMLLIVLVTTDLFTESFFQYKNLEIQFLMFLATLATAMSYVDYFKNRGIDLINKKTDSKLSSLILSLGFVLWSGVILVGVTTGRIGNYEQWRIISSALSFIVISVFAVLVIGKLFSNSKA